MISNSSIAIIKKILFFFYLDNANPTGSGSTTNVSQASNETSSGRDTVLAHIVQQGMNSIPIQQDVNNTPTPKKQPIILPRPVKQHRNENTSSESSSVSQDTTLHRVFPPEVINSSTNLKKRPVPSPPSKQDENTSSESSSVSQDTTLHRVFPPEVINSSTNLKKRPVPSPPSKQDENTSSESSSVSQDTALHRVFPPDVINALTNLKKGPVASPPSKQDEDTSSESSSVSKDTALRRGFPPDVINALTNLKKGPVPSPPSKQDENTSSESSSVSKDTALRRGFPPDVINALTNLKKGPVPSTPSEQDENTSSESSSVSKHTALRRGFPPDVINALTNLKKGPVPLPPSKQDEDTYFELSNDLPDSSNTSQNANNYIGFSGSSVVLPNQINTNRREPVHSESLSVSLDAMLPTKCMFFEFETMINDYQRRDPRTIIYPKIKAAMPKMTANEINTLQRYSNT